VGGGGCSWRRRRTSFVGLGGLGFLGFVLPFFFLSKNAPLSCLAENKGYL
jgi:hypothetical protein